MRQLSAVVTSPVWLIVMGSAVGTVTFIAVPVGSPPVVPSEVEVRLTGVEPEPPEVSISVANAVTDIQTHIQRTSASARNFFIEFSFSPFGI
ncbi:hypothetical protein [Mesotoga sp.]|uniref:hypothetical protein n=1 Tax=Mesotoga sp. TaxID=2053577 RepID=UPI00345E5A83